MNREWVRIFVRKTFHFLVYGFAIIGLVFTGVFFAIRFQWTNVSGSIDSKSELFEKQATQARVLGVASSEQVYSTNGGNLANLNQTLQVLSEKQRIKKENLCTLRALKVVSLVDAQRIWNAFVSGAPDMVIFKMLAAAKNNLSNTSDVDASVQQCLKNADVISNESTFMGSWATDASTKESVFSWSNDEEWGALAQATIKDKEVIDRAARVANIEPRLIVSSLVVEQMRLFHSERELFKKFFEPLKILGNSTIISLGVMGIKPTTAEAIEQHLKDPSSPYYLGAEYEHVLDYSAGVDPDKERFNRLTDDKNRSYIYLYGALYLKQMLHQWAEAGYDIQYRPEIIGTLFNVGFPQSHPNDHPRVGGSTIQVGDREYSFGRLSYEFYYSGQLLNEFPYESDQEVK